VPIAVLAVLVLLGAVWVVGFRSFRRTPTYLGGGAPPAGQAASFQTAGGGEHRTGFDGAVAFRRLKEQCDFGPRVPGTEAHTRCKSYLVEALKPLAARVEEQPFRLRDGERTIQMANIIARFARDAKTNPGANPGSGVLLAAHWDTRPTADQEPELARRRQPILGANDGASGVAILLELARMLKEKPPAVPVWIVLFDGEDYGPGTDRMFLGARHFAANLPSGVPQMGVLLDMVGDKDLQIFKEINSTQRAGTVVQQVWDVAQRLGYRTQFIPTTRYSISDDHLPLLDVGIAMIDLIDFDYPYWHTLGDTVDKCSPASLTAVGDVVATWTYERR
jgi:hypothetical protein